MSGLLVVSPSLSVSESLSRSSMSFFDEVETTVANTRFLQAVEDTAPIVLNLTEFAELKDFEAKVREKLTVRRLLRPNTVGYYLFSKYLQGKFDDVVKLCHALDAFRKAHGGIRKEKARQILADFLGIRDLPKPKGAILSSCFGYY